MLVALFARAALAACLLSYVGVALADRDDGSSLGSGSGGDEGSGDATVSADLIRSTVRLCAQVEGLEYTSDDNECDLALTSPTDVELVCEQARRALDEAIAEPGHGRNRVSVIRKIVAKTCGSDS